MACICQHAIPFSNSVRREESRILEHFRNLLVLPVTPCTHSRKYSPSVLTIRLAVFLMLFALLICSSIFTRSSGASSVRATTALRAAKDTTQSEGKAERDAMIDTNNQYSSLHSSSHARRGTKEYRYHRATHPHELPRSCTHAPCGTRQQSLSVCVLPHEASRGRPGARCLR